MAGFESGDVGVEPPTLFPVCGGLELLEMLLLCRGPGDHVCDVAEGRMHRRGPSSDLLGDVLARGSHGEGSAIVLT